MAGRQVLRARLVYVQPDYGNFDQDNSSAVNDDNIFIGSSNIGDGAGRQLWNFKDGTLRGDRPHMLKLYGYRELPWHASAGAFAIAQSGQPWEAWSYEPLNSRSRRARATVRGTPSGRLTPHPSPLATGSELHAEHPVGPRLNLQLAGDLFNVFDEQTGYDYEPSVHNPTFGTPRWYDAPRRFQLAAGLQF